MREFDSEFTERHENLVKDLEYIDLKINGIGRNITYLQTSIDRMGVIISDAEDNKLRSHYYSIQTEILKTLAMYDSNMQSLLDLKFKYRREQDDLSVKSQRFLHIELEKVKSDIAKTNSSHMEVIDALTKLLSGKVNSNSNNTSSENTTPDNKIPIFDFTPDEMI